MGMEAWPVAAAAAALVLAAASSGLALALPRRRLPLSRAGLALAALASALAAACLASRWRGTEATMWNARFDTLLLALVGAAAGSAALSRPAAFRVEDGDAPSAALLASASAALAGAAIAVLALGEDPEPHYATPAAQALLAVSHYGLRGIGTGLLLVGAAAAAARLVDCGRTSRDDAAWDRVLRGVVVLGLPPFLVATLLGAAWHGEIWAAPWQWDLVETWPFAVILVHLAWLHLRFAGTAGTRGSALLLASGGLLAGGVFLFYDLPAATSSLEVYAGF